MTMAERFQFVPQTTVEGVAAEVLRCFEDERRWMKGHFARTSSGKATVATAKRAVCWCMAGAVIACAADAATRNATLERLAAECGGDIVMVNDLYNIEAVRAVLRKIAKVE